MPDQKKRALLAVDIATTLRCTEIRQRGARLFSNSVAKQLLLTSVVLVAVQPGTLRALTIGELQVRSSLGQPFVASTTARLAPGEVLAPGCVGAIADTPGGNASLVRLNAEVAQAAGPGEYPVRITSAAPLYEPMYEIQLKISCPGILALAKNYVVMLDLGTATPEPQPVATPAAEIRTLPPQIQPVAMATSTENPAVPTVAPQTRVQVPPLPASVKQSGTDEAEAVSAGTTAMPANTAVSISAGSDYRVQSGDTLLTIAERIEDRAGLTTRQFARLLLLENPSAFIGGNPDLIKMGFVITVPSGQATISADDNETSARIETSPARISVAEITGSAVTEVSKQVPQPAITAQEPAAPASNRAEPAQIVAGESILAGTNEREATTKNVAENSAPVTDQSLVTADAGDTADFKPTVAQQTALAATAPAAIATPAKANKLVATASGILVGAILAGLVLGRGFIAAWLPGRLKRRKQLQASRPDSAEAGIDTDVVAEDFSSATPDQFADPTAADIREPAADLAGRVKSTPGSAGRRHAGIEEAEDTTETALATAETTEIAALANATTPAPADFSATDLDAAPENNAPRVSLRGSSSPASTVDFDLSDMEEPLESTRRYSDPSTLAEDNSAAIAGLSKPTEPDGTSSMHNLFGTPDTEAADLDVTSTMHDIFSTAPAVLSDDAETEEVRDLRNRLGDNSFARIDIDNTSSLQALSESLIHGNADDELSKTLTQALGLLEQDYEDELTNSQILEQKGIQKAFAEQAAKDD